MIAAILLAAATASAPVPAPARAASPPPVVGVTQQPFVGLTLQNAIGMALSKNPNLAVAQANRRIAQYQIAAAQGAYDVRLSIEPQYQYITQPPQNAFFAGPNFGPIVQKKTGVTAGAQALLNNGAAFGASVSGTQTYDNTAINTFNPYYPSVFSLTYTQPLGRGRTIDQASRQLQLAQIGAEGSNAQTLTTVSDTIATVENTYWDLAAAWRDVAIQEEALKDTVAQQHSNVRLARKGAGAPIDVVEANAQIAVFEDQVAAALQNVSLLQNQLKGELVTDPADPIWNANIVPTTPAQQSPAQQPSLADLVTQAVRQRPEIAQIRSQVRAAGVNVQYAENQTKPQVDLQLGYTSNGFAGTVLPPGQFFQSSAQQVMAINQLIAVVNKTLPPSQQIPALPASNTPVPAYLSGGLDQSIKNLLANKFPVYTAGVNVTFPIGNRTAKADLGVAREQQRIAQIQEASTIQRVATDVRDALQRLQSAQSRLVAARTARQASEQILASEERRFRAGSSTTFLVLQREIELADNRARELQAQTELNKSIVEIQRATGTILSANDVTLQNVGEGVKP